MKKTLPPCPYCKEQNKVVRAGFFTRKNDKRRVQKLSCKNCGKSFSTQTLKDTYRQKKLNIINKIKMFIISGVSQRQTARMLRIDRKTVRRVIKILALRGEIALKKQRESLKNCEEFFFDEMESFEHTKCKPIAIPLIVTRDRRIVCIDAVSQPAKGPLARIAYKKYGPRKDERPLSISKMFHTAKSCFSKNCTITTDESPFYRRPIKKYFPLALHKTTKGGRGSVAGYSELKKKVFDPMFALNHTAAMLRDHLATLKRRTWTTTKKIPNLIDLLKIYCAYHNEVFIPA